MNALCIVVISRSFSVIVLAGRSLRAIVRNENHTSPRYVGRTVIASSGPHNSAADVSSVDSAGPSSQVNDPPSPNGPTTAEGIAINTSTMTKAESESFSADAQPAVPTDIQAAEPTIAIQTKEGLGGVARKFLSDNPVAGFSILGILGFLGVTLVVAVIRAAATGFTPGGKRTRTVNKNKLVVDELSKYLPGNRSGLGVGAVASLKFRTGFSSVEIFRKYLWFLLRERRFDQEAVDDLVALKKALGLRDSAVADALRERSKRVYDKFGNVMLDTSGMSPAGVERKATSRALFSKLLYLVECEALLAPEEATSVDLRDIFGATEDDAARLRIASLYEVDLDAALEQPAAEGSYTEE